MSKHTQTVGQVDYIQDAPKNGMWYHIAYPNNSQDCEAQLVKWNDNCDLWDTIMIDGEDSYSCLLNEDGSSWADTINT